MVGEKSEPVTADRDGSQSQILTLEVAMSKRSNVVEGTLFCGIDISAKSLAVAGSRKIGRSNKECLPIVEPGINP
jgi:hypothetical protein